MFLYTVPELLSVCLDPPDIHISPSSSLYVVKPGPDIRLYCSVDGNPTPSIQWYRNGIPQHKKIFGTVKEIIIPRGSSNDSAMYECVAENVINSKPQKRNSRIQVQGMCLSLLIGRSGLARGKGG